FMLTGRKPFAAPDLPAVLRKVEVEDPLPIRETEAPPALARIVLKALAKSPAVRYQHCGHLIADLSRVQRDLEEQAKRLTQEGLQRFAAISTILAEQRRIQGRLGIPFSDSAEAARAQLLEK